MSPSCDLVADLAFDLPHGARDVGLDVRHALPPGMGLGTRAGTIAAPMDVPAIVVIVAAHNEADRIEQTLARARPRRSRTRACSWPTTRRPTTPRRARRPPAPRSCTAPRNIGKGGANTLAARRVLSLALTPEPPVFVALRRGPGRHARGSCRALVAAVRRGECDLAVAAFARRVGGGFGVAVGYAHCGDPAPDRARARRADLRPASDARRGAAGRRAVRAAVRDGDRHDRRRRARRLHASARSSSTSPTARPGGRWRGFVHRARQLRDFVFTELSRR